MPPLKRGELRRAMRTTRDDETNFYHEILTYPFFFIQSSTPSYISSGLWAVFLDNCRVYTAATPLTAHSYHWHCYQPATCLATAFALFFHHPPYFLTSWGRRHTTYPNTSTSSSNFFYPSPKKSGRCLPNFILNSRVTTRLGMLSNDIGMKSSRIHRNTNQFRMQLNAKGKAIPTTIPPFGASASATTTRMTMRMTVTSSESGSLRIK